MSNLTLVFIGIILLIGAYTDYTRREIPNWIPLSIFLSGFFTPIASLPHKILSLLVMIVILVLTTKILHQKSGGGDVKLYLSLVFALGFAPFSTVLFLTLLLRILVSGVKGGVRFPLCCYVAPAYIMTMALFAALV